MDDTARLGLVLRYAAYGGLDLSRGSSDWQLLGTTRHRFIKLAEDMVETYTRKTFNQHREWFYHGSSVVNYDRVQEGLNKLGLIKGKFNGICIYDFTGIKKDELDALMVADYVHGAKNLTKDRQAAIAFNATRKSSESYSAVLRASIADENFQHLCNYFNPSKKLVVDALNELGNFSKPEIKAGKIVLLRRELNLEPAPETFMDLTASAIRSRYAPKTHIYN